MDLNKSLKFPNSWYENDNISRLAQKIGFSICKINSVCILSSTDMAVVLWKLSSFKKNAYFDESSSRIDICVKNRLTEIQYFCFIFLFFVHSFSHQIKRHCFAKYGPPKFFYSEDRKKSGPLCTVYSMVCRIYKAPLGLLPALLLIW